MRQCSSQTIKRILLMMMMMMDDGYECFVHKWPKMMVSFCCCCCCCGSNLDRFWWKVVGEKLLKIFFFVFVFVHIIIIIKWRRYYSWFCGKKGQPNVEIVFCLFDVDDRQNFFFFFCFIHDDNCICIHCGW